MIWRISISLNSGSKYITACRTTSQSLRLAMTCCLRVNISMIMLLATCLKPLKAIARRMVVSATTFACAFNSGWEEACPDDEAAASGAAP
eukprot:5778511-Lingulodinium_polyedra.AAC.1